MTSKICTEPGLGQPQLRSATKGPKIMKDPSKMKEQEWDSLVTCAMFPEIFWPFSAHGIDIAGKRQRFKKGLGSIIVC